MWTAYLSCIYFYKSIYQPTRHSAIFNSPKPWRVFETTFLFSCFFLSFSHLLPISPLFLAYTLTKPLPKIFQTFNLAQPGSAELGSTQLGSAWLSLTFELKPQLGEFQSKAFWTCFTSPLAGPCEIYKQYNMLFQ